MGIYKGFKDLAGGKTFLEDDRTGNKASEELRLAVAGMLWEMVHIDGVRSTEEFTEVVRQLDHEFHLMDEESGELIQVADFLRRQSSAFDRFIEEIVVGYSEEQREHLVQMIIQVAKADGIYDQYEQAFVKFLRSRFQLPEEV